MGRRNADVAVTAAAAALSWTAIFFHAPTPVTWVLGITLFISTGYVSATALFGHHAKNLEWMVLAASLALGIPVIGGLVLQLAGLPLHPVTWVSLVAGVTLVGDGLILVRHREGRPPGTPVASKERRARWHVSSRQVVTFIAAIAIAGAATALARVGVAIQPAPRFTELWLSPRAKSGNANVANLGVSNHQGVTTHYKLVLLRKGHISDIWSLTLSNGQVWRRVVSISAAYTTSANLYLLPDLGHPYRHVNTGPSAGPS